ncbi:MAG: DNA repair protein RecO [Lachnospiraceae bacterium]|nr:DNA repair protein RecO [Lachnospiraceae bacterium]
MRETVEVTGVVSFSAPTGEYDRRVVIITRELGRISAFAQGSRKPTSQLVAACRTFTFAKFTLYPGKTAYRVLGAQIVEPFDGMSQDLDAMTYGAYLLELAGFFTEEGVEAGEVVNLLYLSLKALLNKNLENRLIRTIFELRILAINGEAPQVFECVYCGKKLLEGIFIMKKHGIGCKDCFPPMEGDTCLDASAVYAMQYIESAPLSKLYTFKLSSRVLADIADVMRRYYRVYINHTFKTLDMLDTDLFD